MPSLREAAEKLSTLLRESGVYEKIVVESATGDCVLLVAKRGEDLHLIALAAYGDWLYAKIAHSDALPTTAWTCSNVYYTPYGLYAFAKSLEELAEKIRGKQERLEAQRRLLEKALEAGALG